MEKRQLEHPQDALRPEMFVALDPMVRGGIQMNSISLEEFPWELIPGRNSYEIKANAKMPLNARR